MSKPAADPDRYRCAYELVGQRCHNAGTWSPAGSGRWYCPEHRRMDGYHAGANAGPPGGFEALRAKIGADPTPHPRAMFVSAESANGDVWPEGRE